MYQSLLREGKGEQRPWRMPSLKSRLFWVLAPKDGSNLDLRRVLGSRPVGSTTTYCIAPIMAPWLNTSCVTCYNKQDFAVIINLSIYACRG